MQLALLRAGIISNHPGFLNFMKPGCIKIPIIPVFQPLVTEFGNNWSIIEPPASLTQIDLSKRIAFTTAWISTLE